MAKFWKPKHYEAVPHYLQPQLRDPFDYPLRSKQEILEQQGDKPILNFPVQIEAMIFNDTEKYKKEYNRKVEAAGNEGFRSKCLRK